MTDDRTIHLGSKLDPATLDSLADIICGDDNERYPKYRSSSWLTRFFQDVNINAVHDGSTRKWWVINILEQLTPSDLERIILRLADLKEYKADMTQLKLAVKALNGALVMDGLRVSYVNNKPVIKFADQMDINDDIVSTPESEDESDFLNKRFADDINVGDLNLDAVLTTYLQDRVDEAQSCPTDKVALGTIFLLGSALEGMLLAIALSDRANFMTAKSAPKTKTGSVLSVYDWKLSQLIDTCHELGILNLDIKKFSHELRDFRNYIHPYHQMSQNFKPDKHTVNICWQVFKAAFSQLKEYLSK